MMNETWKTIPGYDNFYEVSTLGRVRSLDREISVTRKDGKQFIKNRHGKVLTPQHDAMGYVHYRLADKNGVTILWKRTPISRYDIFTVMTEPTRIN